MTDAAENAIAASGQPIFQRGEALVRPVIQEAPASKGRMTTTAAFRAVTRPAAIDVLTQVAEWERFDVRTKEFKRCDPPALVADILLSRTGYWTKIPSVCGLITTPTLRPDHTILATPGYDRATRLYLSLDPAFVMPDVPAFATREQAAAALERLGKLLVNFPFVSPLDRAVALSALITPVVRGAIPVAPLHAVRAAAASSGKSLLVDTASAIATGQICPVSSAAPDDEAETEKRLVGLLLDGYPIVSIDNCNGVLGGDLLCQAVERLLVRVRPLGASPHRQIESRATFFATGNGLVVRGDMCRRTVTCELDAGVEHPELIAFDFNPVDLVEAETEKRVVGLLLDGYPIVSIDNCNAPLRTPRFRAVARLGVVAQHCGIRLGSAHAQVVGRGFDETAQHVVAGYTDTKVMLVWSHQSITSDRP